MPKKVSITFEDKESLTVKEIIDNLHSIYGANSEVTVSPINNSPTSHIQFGIDQLITEEHAVIFFDQPELYQEKLKNLRKDTVKKILFILNDVIMENEDKFSS